MGTVKRVLRPHEAQSIDTTLRPVAGAALGRDDRGDDLWCFYASFAVPMGRNSYVFDKVPCFYEVRSVATQQDPVKWFFEASFKDEVMLSGIAWSLSQLEAAAAKAVHNYMLSQVDGIRIGNFYWSLLKREKEVIEALVAIEMERSGMDLS